MSIWRDMHPGAQTEFAPFPRQYGGDARYGNPFGGQQGHRRRTDSSMYRYNPGVGGGHGKNGARHAGKASGAPLVRRAQNLGALP